LVLYRKNLFFNCNRLIIQKLLRMTLNLHILHKINILKIEPSLINHQLKGKKRSLQSWSFTPCFVESGTNIL
jgi:hypothetical protein